MPGFGYFPSRMRAFLLLALFATSAAGQTWHFAVSGDSRNCGDIVVPAIAAGVKADDAAFYWHLGDFRRGSNVDEDMSREAGKPLAVSEYASNAWPDFIAHQLRAFGATPVFLAIGNHELNGGHTRADYIVQFGDWLARPEIQAQRKADDALGDGVRTYYHWVQGGVDFIALDSASPEMFDNRQLAWLDRVLERDATDPRVKTIVAGMHEALPHSLACDHSMNESAQGEYSGSLAYAALLRFRKTTGKNVYAIASHAHFWMRDVFDTPYWRAHGGVLPGIIVGTAGAVRYRLPDTAKDSAPNRARTDTYGYALATVQADGTIAFEFREIRRAAIPADVVSRYGAEGVDWCFAENRNLKARTSEPCSRADAPAGPAGKSDSRD